MVTTNSITSAREEAIARVKALDDVVASAHRIANSFAGAVSLHSFAPRQQALWRKSLLLFVVSLIDLRDRHDSSSCPDGELLTLLEANNVVCSRFGLSAASSVRLAHDCVSKVLLWINAPPWEFGFGGDATSVEATDAQGLGDADLKRIVKVAKDIASVGTLEPGSAGRWIAEIEAETSRAMLYAEPTPPAFVKSSPAEPAAAAPHTPIAPATPPEAAAVVVVAPQAIAPNPKPVILNGPSEHPLVLGKEVPLLSGTRYKVAKALADAFPNRLSGNQLRKASGLSDAVNILKGLATLPDWKPVISLGKKAWGQYGFVAPTNP